MTRTIGIFACATALLTGCYESYFAVPDGDWDVLHPADDGRGDVRDRGGDADADVEIEDHTGADADGDADADADGDADGDVRRDAETGDDAYADGDVWRTRAPMITPRGLLSTAALDGKLYAIGGATSEIPAFVGTAVNEVYDPATDTWTERAPMPTVRGAAQAVAVGGRILVLGGWTGGRPELDTVEEYDPATDRWTSRAPMPTPRSKFTAAVVSGLVYAIGGGDVVSVNEVYDPVADAWSTRAPMPTPRGHMASGVLDGRIYVVGGFPDQATNEVYDPAMDRWESAPPMPNIRAYHGAAFVGGRLHVLGGSVDSSFLGNRSHQIFDPTTGVWSTGADLPVGRLGVEDGVEVLDGTLYVVGCSSYDTGGVTGLLHSLTP